MDEDVLLTGQNISSAYEELKEAAGAANVSISELTNILNADK
jgi:hypothetical protein